MPTSTIRSSAARLATRTLCVAAVLAASRPVHATDGYFSNGYGIKSKGRAGVAIAQTDDAFGGANNPASVAWVGERVDFGVDWFRPDRSASRSGPAAPFNGSVESTRENFFIPELAYARPIRDDLSLGIAVYGNGGMNTTYPAGQLNFGPGASGLNLLAGPGRLGVNLAQVLIAPTLSWKFTANQSVGVAPIVAYQTFKAYGLGSFSDLSQDSGALTDVGNDHAWGGGVRVGYLWNISKSVSVGAQYSSRVYSERLDKYRGLFAGDGSFDIPQSGGIGIAWQATPEVRLAADYKYIDYASIDAVGNPSSNPGRLGQTGGPGFGWRSINVFKAGVDWKVSDHWTLRSGYSFNQNPVRENDVTFNIVAPAVIQHHLTFGITYATGRHEVTLAYLHAFRNSITGESRFVALGLAPAGTRETIEMTQNSLGLSYAYKF